ncbi:LOW QUALITY PROTEIN: hypothetical protein PanWU01x14_034660 [Parasponia andersonii]|uniref:Uncharacterized protein n=1 Tax=Parasponia andersonii TaxID=3476 RepID=A0A2P5DT13_PARAD|nr:LOW QUALITY PROTEIN: hypothetical protein PanWU01x14_034660 [Parasponia andersonii]
MDEGITIIYTHICDIFSMANSNLNASNQTKQNFNSEFEWLTLFPRLLLHSNSSFNSNPPPFPTILRELRKRSSRITIRNGKVVLGCPIINLHAPLQIMNNPFLGLLRAPPPQQGLSPLTRSSTVKVQHHHFSFRISIKLHIASAPNQNIGIANRNQQSLPRVYPMFTHHVVQSLNVHNLIKRQSKSRKQCKNDN